MNNPFTSVYSKYISIKKKLTSVKKEEMSMRKELISKCSKPVIEGTVSEEIDDFLLKYGFKINRSVDKAVLDTIWENLNDEEKLCISFEPKLNLKNYKALQKLNPKSELMKAIVEKPGTGTLLVAEL